MASDLAQKTVYHSQEATRTFNETTSSLQQVKIRLRGWDDSVGMKAGACYDRIYNTFKEKGTQDTKAISLTANALADCAQKSQQLSVDLERLSVTLSQAEEAIERG